MWFGSVDIGFGLGWEGMGTEGSPWRERDMNGFEGRPLRRHATAGSALEEHGANGTADKAKSYQRMMASPELPALRHPRLRP